MEIKENIIDFEEYYHSELSKTFVFKQDLVDDYFEKYKEGCLYAKDILLTLNLKLVRDELKKYTNQSNPYYWDYFQCGVIGLIKSIEGFDIDKGYKFPIYAYNSIKRHIFKGIKNYPHTIKKSVYLHGKYNEINKIRKEYNNSNAQQTMDFICEKLGISNAKYIDTIFSIEENVINLEFDNNSLGESLGSFETPESIYLEKERNENLERILLLALPNEKDRDILKRREGLSPYDKIQTLEEISKIYNLTSERIRQIQENSYTKLRKFKVHEDFEFTQNEKKIKSKKDAKNKITYVSNTLFAEEPVIAEPKKLIKDLFVKANKAFAINEWEALGKYKEIVIMLEKDEFLLDLNEQKEVYSNIISLIKTIGKVNQIDKYISKLQILENHNVILSNLQVEKEAVKNYKALNLKLKFSPNPIKKSSNFKVYRELISRTY